MTPSIPPALCLMNRYGEVMACSCGSRALRRISDPGGAYRPPLPTARGLALAESTATPASPMTLRLPFSAAAADRRMTPGRLLAARRDAIILAQAGARPGHHDEWEPARKFLQDTEEPRLPFSGADFIARGITDGRGPVTRDDAIWRVIEPVFRAGETYPLPRDISRADAFAYWRIGQRGVRRGRRRTDRRHLLLARQQSRWRQPRCELRLYCRGKRQSTRGGTGDVRTFAGASARAWLHRHAVQFCNFQQ
jgi:hypothetical protein